MRARRTIQSVAVLLFVVTHGRAAIVDPLANGPSVVDSPVANPANPFTISDLPITNQNQPSQPTSLNPDAPSNTQPAAGNGAPEVLPAPGTTVSPAGIRGTTAPGAAKAPPDPCSFAPIKPFHELGINIDPPDGKLPIDQAGLCWQQINTRSDTGCDRHCWPILLYQWDATSLAYHPLYFEEINLERYGYGCGCCCCCGLGNCVQPFVSGAHFFGTLPILPYCMAHECPGDCVYTLGHYRPGSCPPWQTHYPPFDPVAAAAEAGFWVGMAAAFP